MQGKTILTKYGFDLDCIDAILWRFGRQLHIKQSVFFHHEHFGAIASEGEMEGGANANGERVLAAGVGLNRFSIGHYLYAS